MGFKIEFLFNAGLIGVSAFLLIFYELEETYLL